MHFMTKMFKCSWDNILYCLIYSILIKVVYCMNGPDLTILNVTENRIHVEWTLINNPYVTIEKYQVSAYPIKSYSKKDKFGGNEWTFYNTTFRSDLVGLHPGTLYNISVWATTNKGHTDPTTKNVWTEIGDPNPLSPVEIIRRNDQTMLINIPAGQNDNGPITSYEVIVLEKNSIVIFNPDELTNYQQAEKSGLPFYITAALAPEDANSSFTVGDSKHYNGYFNAPLAVDKDYDILVGVVSSLNGIRKVSYSPLQSDMENQNSGNIPKASKMSKFNSDVLKEINENGYVIGIWCLADSKPWEVVCCICDNTINCSNHAIAADKCHAKNTKYIERCKKK